MDAHVETKLDNRDDGWDDAQKKTHSTEDNDSDNEDDNEDAETLILNMYEVKGDEDFLETSRSHVTEQVDENQVDEANMLTWRKGFVVGKSPTKRSGHTFTVLGTNAFLFGGCDAQSTAGPTGELWQLKMLGNFEWIRLDDQVNKQGGVPLARWLHSACVYDKKFILYFGGFHSSKRRLNDLWMFDTITLQWSLLYEGYTGTPGIDEKISNLAPPPRGGHTASIIGDKMWVFGGYGGQGYSRKDFNDLFLLNLHEMEWEQLPQLKGVPPRPRSGHSATVVDSCIYIHGGWNAVEQLSDLSILDTRLNTWSTVETFMDPRWGHTSCPVEAIPYWKIFYFGGCTGNLVETKRAQGTLSSKVLILDTGTCVFDRPKVRGDMPCGRTDTTFGYDVKGSRLVMFGGWANQWLDDIYTLDVGCIVGPPYAILGIFPRQGPLTGGTEIMISGMDFVHDPKDPRIKVRFIAKGGHILDANGVFVNSETITCVSPNFDELLNGDLTADQLEVDVRIAIKDDSFTTTFQKYTFLSVTVAEQCLAFGPGLTSGGYPGAPTMFVIQANDVIGLLRSTGGDEFEIRIRNDDIAVLDATIEDNEDGSYAVDFTIPAAGEYTIEIEYTGRFVDETGQKYNTGKSGHIRGSPFTVYFDENAAKSSNKMNGPLVREAIERRFQYTKKLVSATRVQLLKSISPGYAIELAADIKAVIAVKEKLFQVEAERAEIELSLDVTERVALHLAENYGVKSEKRVQDVAKVREEWKSILDGQPNLIAQSNAALRPHVIAHGEKTKDQLLEYEASVISYEETVKRRPCFKWNTGPEGALSSLVETVEIYEARLEKHEDMKKLAKLFEFPELVHGATTVMERISKLLEHAQEMWEVASDALIFVDESKSTLWRKVKPDVLEDEARKRLKIVKALPRDLRESNAYLGLEQEVKNFVLTCPLIAQLGNKAMRIRHWEELQSTIGQSFAGPHENKSLRLGEVLDLGLHNFAAQVESIANRAGKEAKVEAAMTKIERAWSTLQFLEEERVDLEDAPPRIFLSEEDLQLLEADQLTVDAMANSPYMKPFEDAYTTAEGLKGKGVKYWKTALGNIVKIVGFLEHIQQTWAYLGSLFLLSEEVKIALPNDAKRFVALDTDVRKFLEDAVKIKIVLKFCTTPKLAENMEEIHEQLEICKKSLGDFLATKRSAFPRLYFASENQVLDILTKGSDPKHILSHISKIFPQMSTLQTENDTYASHWFSSDGLERGAFDKPVILKGKVEEYLRDVWISSQQSVKVNLEKSLVRYKTQQRKDWVIHKAEKDYAFDLLQISLMVCNVVSTQEMEGVFSAFKSGNRSAMQDYAAKVRQQLMDISKVSRSKNLCKNDRRRISAIVSYDIHSRDLVEDFISNDVTSAASFEWKKHLKQYPDGKTEICDAILQYGFEYVGNYPRLVRTPRTDQVLISAARTLKLQLGGIFTGLEVVGKSEMMRELASTMGSFCYVYNCTPELDFRSIGNLLTGAAAAGAWIAFDQVDRLTQEVLSSLAWQLKHMCDARQSKQSVFRNHSGVEIELMSNFVVLASLRGSGSSLVQTRCPQAFKTYMRPTSLAIPHTKVICEALLAGEGFLEYSELANKLFELFEAGKTYLPHREYYDWTLRSLKSVISAAGTARQAETDDTVIESKTVLQVLHTHIMARLATADTPVMRSILEDLFPKIVSIAKVDPDLDMAVKEACAARELWPEQHFLSRIVDLDELLKLRQAVILLGDPGIGKSECWKTLQRAHQMLKRKTIVKTVYTKAQSIEQLYGFLTPSKNEWRDGILSRILRDIANNSDNTTPKWLVLDGEHDSEWTDSMSTLFGEDRFLTVSSAERIAMKEDTHMIFEMSTLAHASPAAASRTGILYFSNDQGAQWRSLVAAWIQRKEWEDHVKEAITILFETYLPVTLAEVQRSYRSHVKMYNTHLVSGVLHLLDAIISAEEERLTDTPDDVKEATRAIEPSFVYCVVWGIGMPLINLGGTDYRREFSAWWKTTFKNVKFPSRDTVFDYFLDVPTGKFDLWKNSPNFATVSVDVSTIPIHDIIIPTPETTRASYWLERLVAMEHPTLLMGSPGVGKTSLIRGSLRELDLSEQIPLSMNLDYFSTAATFQARMELALEKKSANSWGPPGDETQLVVFLDDLNLPQADKFGSQEVLAYLRQQIETGQVYDRSTLATKQIQGCQYLACMSHTSASNPVDARLLRHFVLFSIELPDVESLQSIYQTILGSHLENFDDGVKALGSGLVEGAIGLHLDVSNKMRASISAPHYNVSLRHLTSVFQGLLMAQPNEFTEPAKMIQLWVHESDRVYGDRLVSEVDMLKYRDLLQSQVKRRFPTANLAKYFGVDNSEPLIFCHFASEESSQDEDPPYAIVEAYDDLIPGLESALAEYNETKSKLDIFFFDEVIDHLCRVSRILQCQRNHGLLVGIGGCGKKSLVRLASYVAACQLYQLPITSGFSFQDFKEELKGLFMQSGINRTRTVLLLPEGDIIDERFLVYLADLISTGSKIEELFVPEEREAIAQSVQSKAKLVGRGSDLSSCFHFFEDAVRDHLHCLFCMDPRAGSFASWIRKFPTLMSCSVIDWFRPYPDRSLRHVARIILEDMDFDSKEVYLGVQTFMTSSYRSACKLAEQYTDTEKHLIHLPIKCYVENLRSFKARLVIAQAANRQKKVRLESVAEKMKEADHLVATLEEIIRAQSADADEKTMLASAQAEEVARDAAVIEKESEIVSREQAKVDEISAEADAIRADSRAEFDKAEPLIKEALDAYDLLTKKDLGECKAMSAAPKGIDDVFCAVLILLAGVDPRIKLNKNGKPKSLTWDNCKKELLGNINEFLNQLKLFKDAVEDFRVPKINWANVRPILNLQQFNAEAIEQKNKAAGSLATWVEKMVAYYDAILCVEPKRQLLEEVDGKLAKATQILDKAKAKVGELEIRLTKLREELEKLAQSRDEAIASLKLSQLKLELAQRLTTALSSETERWAATIETLDLEYGTMVGDMLVGTAFLSYAGPFPERYRKLLIDSEWLPSLVEAAAGEEIPVREGFKAADVVTSAADLAAWRYDGLSQDPVSTENAALILNGRGWPIIIDPQMQALPWLKTWAKRLGKCHCIHQNNLELLKELSKAMSSGETLIIENVSLPISRDLLPLIFREIIMRGPQQMIRIGENEVELHSNFRLMLHFGVAHPILPADILSMCPLVNFTVSRQGLQDHLLALTTRKEHRELSEQSVKLSQLEKKLAVQRNELEDAILVSLADAEGDVCADVDLINNLERSKKRLASIAHMANTTEECWQHIQNFFEKYRSVAQRGSLLFSTMNAMYKLHPSYQYSLNSFVSMFIRGIDLVTKPPAEQEQTTMVDRLRASVRNSVVTTRFRWDEDTLVASTRQLAEGLQSDDVVGNLDTIQQVLNGINMSDGEVEERCVVLKRSITNMVFCYLQYGLFAKDSLTIATQICFQILLEDGELDSKDLLSLITCKSMPNVGSMGPLSSWMPAEVWARIKALESSVGLQTIGDDVMSDSDEWRNWYASLLPEEKKLPGDLGELNEFKRLLIFLAIRPDRLCNRVSEFVCNTLGPVFVDRFIGFDLDAIFQTSSPSAPILLVSLPGSDPMEIVARLGAAMNRRPGDAERFIIHNLPLQNLDLVETSIRDCAEQGHWVMIQNIHLASSWLFKLEVLLSDLSKSAHEDFRCFLVTTPESFHDNLPEMLVQACVKVVWETGIDLKTNVELAWMNFPQEFIDNCPSNRVTFQQGLLILSFLHAQLLGRKKFSTLGWSESYEFGEIEIQHAAKALQKVVSTASSSENIKWEELRYIIGNLIYGSQMNNYGDLRVVATHVNSLFQSSLVTESSKGKPELAPRCLAPEPGLPHKHVLAHIRKAWPSESPETYGLKNYIDRPYWVARQKALCNDLRRLSGIDEQSQGQIDRQGKLRMLVKVLLEKCPGPFAFVEIRAKAEPLISDSPKAPLILVALQEIELMNTLLDCIRVTLEELQKALEGAYDMTNDMFQVSEALLKQEIPRNGKYSWLKAAWPSSKPLDGWFEDVVKHVEQLRVWTAEFQLPKSLWLPGFLKPLALITAIRQVVARKEAKALHEVRLQVDVTTCRDPDKLVSGPPDDGLFLHGLLIEGARYYLGDAEDDALEEREYFADEEEQNGQDFVSGNDDVDNDEEEVGQGSTSHQYMRGKILCGGYIVQSGLKEPYTQMPVLLIRGVLGGEQDSKSQQHEGWSKFICPLLATSGLDDDEGKAVLPLLCVPLRSRVPHETWDLAKARLLLRS